MMTKLIIPITLFTLLLFSFTPSTKKGIKIAKKSLEQFAGFVPSGSITFQEQTLSVQAFYMSKTEITNFQYREFLDDLSAKGATEKLKIAIYDSVLWRGKSGNHASMVKYYHSHPAYDNYPVVNITKEGAELYSQWLSEQYRDLSNGEMIVEFRLPTHAEWLRAAKADMENSPYTWGGPFLENKNGCKLANFLALGSENITRDPETGELIVTTTYTPQQMTTKNYDITAPAKSYTANEFGMYCMNGNVAELVSDKEIVAGGSWNSPGYDVRNESTAEYQGAAPTVGFRVVATYLDNSSK